MKLVDVGRLNPGRSDERLRPQASTQLASSVHLNVGVPSDGTSGARAWSQATVRALLMWEGVN
jgi:hypothetical protein